MADQKLQDMTENTALATEDLIYTVDDPSGTPVDRKVEAGFLLGALLKESHIDGFITANNGTDSDHDIDFGAGTASVTDDTDWTIATTSATITKQIDATWSVGDDAGGLDTGTVASDTWYHMWVIMRADTHVVDFLFSLSETAPTMPTGYTYRRRIGSVLTDGSANITAYKQSGDEFFWEETQNDIALTTTSATWASVTGILTPDDVTTLSILNVGVSDSSSATPFVQLWHADWTTPTTHAYTVQSQLSSSSELQTAIHRIYTTAASPPAFQYYAEATTNDMYVRTLGWQDPRGRTW